MTSSNRRQSAGRRVRGASVPQTTMRVSVAISDWLWENAPKIYEKFTGPELGQEFLDAMRKLYETHPDCREVPEIIKKLDAATAPRKPLPSSAAEGVVVQAKAEQRLKKHQ